MGKPLPTWMSGNRRQPWRQVSMESSTRKRRRENRIAKEEITESHRADMTSTYMDDNEWSPPPYPHVIRRDRFCITRQDFHEVYGLSLDGQDPRTFSRDVISPSDWLSVFTEPQVINKVKVRTVVPALYRELTVLYQKVYQEPPVNRVSVAFARGFAFENCKSSLETTNRSYFRIAWAVLAEGSMEIVRKCGRLERKRNKWMSVRNGVQLDSRAESPAPSCSPSCDLPQPDQWDGTVPATPATEGDSILTPAVANLLPASAATEEGDIILTPPVANLVLASAATEEGDIILTPPVANLVPASAATEEGDIILTPPVANLVPASPAKEEGDIMLTPPVANLVPSTLSSGVSPPPRPTSPVPEVPSPDLASSVPEVPASGLTSPVPEVPSSDLASSVPEVPASGLTSPVPEVPASDPQSTSSSQSDHFIRAQTFLGLQWCEFIKHPDLPHDLAKEVQVVERCSDLLGSGWADVRQAMEPLDCSKLETIFATILKLRSSLNAGIRIMQTYENDVMNELKKIVIRQAEEIRQQAIAARQKERETEQRLEEAERKLAAEQQICEKLQQMTKERLKAWSTDLITSWDNVVRGYR